MSGEHPHCPKCGDDDCGIPVDLSGHGDAPRWLAIASEVGLRLYWLGLASDEKRSPIEAMIDACTGFDRVKQHEAADMLGELLWLFIEHEKLIGDDEAAAMIRSTRNTRREVLAMMGERPTAPPHQ